MSRITAYCHLNEHHCSVNGEVLLTRDATSDEGWLKQLYKSHEFAYPKFHKMDTLAQAGFITSELIKRANPRLVTEYKDDEVAMLFANQTSSLETDQRFKASYEKNGAPSPAIFVYTLPNIVLGEIAILNKWYGENMFVVLPKFAPDFFVNYTGILFSGGSKAVLCGWLEIAADNMEVFLFLVESERMEGLEFDVAGLNKLYK
jgi:hypothetical protein